MVPSRALSRRSRRLLYAAVLLTFVAIIALVTGAVLRFIPLVVPSNPTYATYVLVHNALLIVGGGLLVVVGAMVIRALTWRQENTLALSIGEYLATFLDKRYVFIRNISRRAVGYVDAVLVGPPGVLVFRVCSQQGVYYNEGSKWMQQRDQGAWHTLTWAPTDEVIADIQKVREYLEAQGVPSPQVFGVVVFLDEPPRTVVTVSNPTVPVAQVSDLQERLAANYFALLDRHDATSVTRMAELLYL